MSLLLLAACTPSGTVGPDGIEVRAWTLDTNASGGVLVVQTSHEDDIAVSLTEPVVEGLTFTSQGLVTESLGGRTVLTQRFRFAGKKGFYEVPALVVTSEGASGQSLPVWIDLGVTAPNAEKIDDITDPSVAWDVPYGWICGVSVVGGLFIGGVLIAFAGVVRRPKVETFVEVPADVRCLKAWEGVWHDEALTEEERATELSRIFREYVQEVLQFPAVSWTTTEILDHLGGMDHLPDGNVPRAKKLLQATDIVKYAEASPDGGFFEEADIDIRAFVASTRPTAWPVGGDGDG